MTLSGIESRLYDRLGFTAVPPADVVTRLRRYLNDAYRATMKIKGMARLRRAVLTTTSVANVPLMALPQVVTRVLSVQDRTNQRLLQEISLDEIRVEDPALSSQTTFPYAYAVLNSVSPVALQPSNPSELFAQSSDAADTGAAKTIYVEGIISGGYYRTASVALNGTTAVSLGAAITTWETITKVSLANATGAPIPTTATGNITLHEDSGVGPELSRIPIGRSIPRYTLVHLYPFPTTSLTYYIDAELHLEDLTSAADEFLVPEDFYEILIEGALMYEYERRENYIAYGQAKARHKDVRADLLLWLQRMAVGTETLSHRSQLGPYYPPGS